MNTLRKPYFYKHLQRTEPADIKIQKLTIGASLSIEASPTTKSIALLNSGMNPEKYEYLCQVEDLNLGG
jgi:hypothetical protein